MSYTFNSVNIQEMQLFSDHLVVYERENGLPKIRIYNLPATGEPLDKVQGGRSVDFVDPIYSVDSSESQFSSSVLRFHYCSMRTPPSVYDYDMNSGVSVLKKTDVVSYHISLSIKLPTSHLPQVFMLWIHIVLVFSFIKTIFLYLFY